MSRRRPILRCALLGLLVGVAGPVAASAHAAGTLTIDGHGYGHGVGMSQYGAYGYAQHGANYQQILAHYYTGTGLGRLPSSPEVGVLLATGRRSVTVTQADRVGGVALDPTRAYTFVTTKLGRLVVRDDHGKKVATAPGAVRVSAGGAPVKLRGTAGDAITDGEYRGALAIRPEGVNDLSVVNDVDLEDYVRGVVGAESPSNWPAEALRAQAVAARTYAVSTDAGAGAGYTQYADTRSQVYHGVAAETPSTDGAVSSTGQQVVTYQGRPIVAYFFSTSGGRTENVENGFPGAAPEPYLVSVDDPYDTTSPRHSWRVRLTLQQAGAKLGGLLKGSLRRITVLRRGASPRILRARIVGSGGSTDVDGATLRRRFGLDDSWAHFTVVSTTASRRTVRRVVPVAPPPPPPAPPTLVIPILGLRATVAPTPTADLRFSGWASFATVTHQTPQPTTGARVVRPPLAHRVRLRELRGRVIGGRHGLRLRVQRGVGGGRWSTVAAVRTSARGFYVVRVPRPGVYRLRAGGLIGPDVRAR